MTKQNKGVEKRDSCSKKMKHSVGTDLEKAQELDAQIKTLKQFL